MVSPGRTGSKRVIYALVYVDGKLAGRIVQSSTMLSPPVNQVMKVGSKPQPQPSRPAPEPPRRRATAD